jgi:hypothetical protein
MDMNIFSDVVTVAGVSAGILLFLALAVAPWLTELPAPRKRALPADATGSLPVGETPEPEVALPTQAAGRGTVAVREAQIVLPVQRTNIAVVVPGQRAATHLS